MNHRVFLSIFAGLVVALFILPNASAYTLTLKVMRDDGRPLGATVNAEWYQNGSTRKEWATNSSTLNPGEEGLVSFTVWSQYLVHVSVIPNGALYQPVSKDIYNFTETPVEIRCPIGSAIPSPFLFIAMACIGLTTALLIVRRRREA